MVHSRKYNKNDKPINPRSAYWKLPSFPGTLDLPNIINYLNVHGYDTDFDLDQKRAITLLARCQRGLPAYDGWTTEWITSLIRDRGLDMEGSRTILIRRLERSDEDLIFPLLDLPLELRSLIYTFYFDSYDTMIPGIFHMPPATRIKELQDETLPVFYSRCHFSFDFRLSDKMRDISFQHSIPRCKYVNYISAFSITLFDWYGDTGERWDFDLHKGGSMDSQPAGKAKAVAVTMSADTVEAMRDVGRAMASRPSQQKFSLNDIKDILRLLRQERRAPK